MAIKIIEAVESIPLPILLFLIGFLAVLMFWAIYSGQIPSGANPTFIP